MPTIRARAWPPRAERIHRTAAYTRPALCLPTLPLAIAPSAMADPFEVRQRFTTLLAHLSASHTSIQKAAHYALKNRDMDEDLHSCILEQLERTNMNTRANIMFFIESLCEMAVKDSGPSTGEGSAMGFVRMLQRDILPVVECVIGDEGANVRVVRKVRRPPTCTHRTRTTAERLGPEHAATNRHPPPRDSRRARCRPPHPRARRPLRCVACEPHRCEERQAGQAPDRTPH